MTLHRHQLTRVFTIQGRSYQVCVECGAEVEYDLIRMQPLKPRTPAKSQNVAEVLKRA